MEPSTNKQTCKFEGFERPISTEALYNRYAIAYVVRSVGIGVKFPNFEDATISNRSGQKTDPI